ncbi:MAG: PD40 domain-containing protein [Chloroflexi bacterium]|nr:PD40 domain-containing protein [Chloroflexota bacterium]
MTRKPHLIVALALTLALVVSACNSNAPAPTSTGVQSNAPTVTPAPTSTAVQLNTPTVIPTPTPEPCLSACARVSAEDIGALQQLAQINKGRITDIAVSPDSAKLAVAVMAGVYIYDTATLEQLDFIADGSLMESVAFSPDGQDLAIGSYYQIHFYSAEGFEKRETLGGPFSAVYDLVYTADGKTLGALGGFRSAFLVDAGTKEYKALEADEQVFSLAFSPSGDTAYLGTVSAIAVWDAATGEQTQLVEKSECTRSVYLADVPETASSALACDRAAQILEGESVIQSAQAAEGAGDALSVAGGPTNHAAIGRSDGQVEVWDAAAMEATLWNVSGHALAVHSLAFMPDGEALFSATNTEIKKWAFAPSAPLRAGDGMELGVIDGFSNNIQNFVFPPNGKPALSEAEGLLFVMGGKVWQLPPDQCFGQLSQAAEVMALDESVSYAALSSDGALAATLSGSYEKKDFSVALFNLADGAEINRIELGQYIPGHEIVFSADGEFWAIALDKNVMILNRQGEPVEKVSSNDWITNIAFSPDGKYLAATDGKGVLTVWDVGTWKVVNKITGVEDYTYSMEFSPDSSKVAIAYSSGKVILVEISTGEIVLTLTGHGAAYDMAFTPDGKILITAPGDHTVRFWDAAGGEEIYWLALPGSVTQMKFSTDGKLYLATYEGVIRVFGIPCAAAAAGAQYPALNAGAQPTPTPAPVSAKCIIALDPPATYKLDGDFHVFGFPPGYSPVPKTTILWSNLKKATESNGRVTIWIPASRATVAVDPATNVITVAIPNCNLPYDK